MKEPIIGRTIEDILAEWRDFWGRHGIDVDLSNCMIPNKKDGFDRLLVIPQGLTINRVVVLCQQKLEVSEIWVYANDMDEATAANERTADESYAVWVRDHMKDDEKPDNPPAVDSREKCIGRITLMERLVFELKFYDETGRRLDIDGGTLCAGSRCFSGFIPFVAWFNNELIFGWCVPGSAFDDLRDRTVVASES